MAKKSTAKSQPSAAPVENAAPVQPSAPPKRLIGTARPPVVRVPKDAPAATRAPVKSVPIPAQAPLARNAAGIAAKAPAPAAPAKSKPAAKILTIPPKNGAAPKPRAKKSAASRLKHEDVALRAYLIAENRHRHGIHAEPHEDWLEAERQLRSESQARR